MSFNSPKAIKNRKQIKTVFLKKKLGYSVDLVLIIAEKRFEGEIGGRVLIAGQRDRTCGWNGRRCTAGRQTERNHCCWTRDGENPLLLDCWMRDGETPLLRARRRTERNQYCWSRDGEKSLLLI